MMKMEQVVRIFAGCMVLLSLALTQWVHPGFVWLTVFVGFNLIQSALTGFCPAEIFFKKIGIGRG
jgi:hypothetical protein